MDPIARCLKLALTVSLLLTTERGLAANCGADDCGEHGSCKLSSLLPRCECDEGYFSVSTFLAPSSLGAYCVPMAAPPSEHACSGIDCGAHGVCVVPHDDAGSSAALCICDLGYRVGTRGDCEDDPANDSEAVCQAVDCGTNTCMATSDAVTCRCSGGGQVVLGSGADGGFGPVCSVPPDPATACGPDACGPWGSCVISQAIFCDCEEGSTQRDFTGPDGKPHPYCARPGETFPQQHTDAGADAAVAETGSGTGDPAVQGDAVQGDGGGCRLVPSTRPSPRAVWWSFAVFCAVLVRRRTGRARTTKAVPAFEQAC
jgi:hypothetical protein